MNAARRRARAGSRRRRRQRRPIAAIAAPSDSTRVSRWRGADPTASRMPNSRVRALTENASTPGDADHRNQQRDAGEAGEDERVQPLRRQHLGAHVFERRGSLDRLIRRQLADDARDRRHERVRVARRAHEQPAGDADLRHRLIDRHRRRAHEVLVVDVGDDADDAAAASAWRRSTDRSTTVPVHRVAVREQPLRDALADDRRPVRAAAVLVGEVAARHAAAGRGPEEARRDHAEPRARDSLRRRPACSLRRRTAPRHRSCRRRATARTCRPRRLPRRAVAAIRRVASW